MNYKSALDYVLSFADYERMPRSALVFDLRRIEMLLERLGNPQEAAKSIHIAGTKGKGSTAAMIASILIRAGYETGLYTSPHLLSVRERIQINDMHIGEDDFARLVTLMKPEVEAVNNSGAFGELTTFELLTALAFAYFKEMKVDYQVLETGLGGRLDATNVVKKPDVCVITSISFDHTDVLGDTLAKIAVEKAGIIKTGGTVVCSPQLPEAMAVIERVCREREVRLVRVSGDVIWQCQTISHEGQSFQLRGMIGEYNLNLPLLGEHQLENAATAVVAAEVLNEMGAKVSSASIATGLAKVRWPGRLQILQRKPWVVVDGAHNADSAKRLVKALKGYFDFSRLILVFGASSDKNIAGMVAELASLPDEVIVTRSRHPRAIPAERLVNELSKKGVIPEVTENVAAAVELAMTKSASGDLVCATGSLFIVAEVMEYMMKRG
ncbi:bifunctional folylpolyglutamate synthase/dihydrofolate synthase [Chloroflexota bacterium]